MRVAFYSKYYDQLLGVFELTPSGIVVTPSSGGSGEAHNRHELQKVLRDRKHFRGTDEEWLRDLPKFWRHMALPLEEGQDPPQGHDDQDDARYAPPGRAAVP